VVQTIFGTMLSLIRRVVYALQTPQQTAVCDRLVEMIIPYSHPNQLHNRLGASLFQAVLCNLLVFLDKSSPVFLHRSSGSNNPADSGSIEIYDVPSNKSYRIGVVEIALSLAMNSLGEAQSILDSSSNTKNQYYWLENVAERQIQSHNPLQGWQFGPAQLFCLLANKVWVASSQLFP
jgi:hypothetical protein